MLLKAARCGCGEWNVNTVEMQKCHACFGVLSLYLSLCPHPLLLSFSSCLSKLFLLQNCTDVVAQLWNYSWVSSRSFAHKCDYCDWIFMFSWMWRCCFCCFYLKSDKIWKPEASKSQVNILKTNIFAYFYSRWWVFQGQMRSRCNLRRVVNDGVELFCKDITVTQMSQILFIYCLTDVVSQFWN